MAKWNCITPIITILLIQKLSQNFDLCACSSEKGVKRDSTCILLKAKAVFSVKNASPNLSNILPKERSKC